MARWLVGPDNPLTARVLAEPPVGRALRHRHRPHLEDFGTSGEAPSHPGIARPPGAARSRPSPLVDQGDAARNDAVVHLPAEPPRITGTRRTGSRQPPARPRTAHPPERRNGARPGARGRRAVVREDVRSAGLSAAAGGVWSSVYSGASWKDSTGEDRYRRGIYTYSKRTSGFPGFLTFDAPSRDLCSARRMDSNTPSQALGHLNDPAHIEAAQGLAKRMESHARHAGRPDRLRRAARHPAGGRAGRCLMNSLRAPRQRQ